MMKKYILALVLPLLITLSSCQPPIQADIVVTMFPQYDIVKAIVGDKLSVHSILPPGVEVHDFEASSQDLVTMKNAKLVLYTSAAIDSWMNESLFSSELTNVINLSNEYSLDVIEHDDDHDHDTVHYWVDPLILVELVSVIKDAIITLDTINADFYRANATSYINDIMATHDAFMSYLTINNYLEKTIYFAGHNALGLFGARHHLDIHGLFSDFKPDEDLGSLQIQQFVTEVKETNTHYLFIEEMVTPKAALTIKNELARQNYPLTLLELHAYHNLSKSDYDNNVGYQMLYERNIANIKRALNGETND